MRYLKNHNKGKNTKKIYRKELDRDMKRWINKANIFYAIRNGDGLENLDGWMLFGSKYINKIQKSPEYKEYCKYYKYCK